MLNWLKSIFSAPKPSGPPKTIRLFQTSDATLSKDSITVAQDRWVVDAKEDQTIRLFEIQNPDPRHGGCALFRSILAPLLLLLTVGYVTIFARADFV